MSTNVAVWIDHRQAVITAIAGETESTSRVESGVEKHARFSGREGAAEDHRDHRFENHLRAFYEAVIEKIRGADGILLMGPGEASHELEKSLRGAGLGKKIVGVETTDKMTDHQIAARARRQFLETLPGP